MSTELTLLKRFIKEVAEPNSGEFKVGDNIFFGKYKNKKGIIVAVDLDEKDHVSIEIEPFPKGRKKNVKMGLYKVWRADKEFADELESASCLLVVVCLDHGPHRDPPTLQARCS